MTSLYQAEQDTDTPLARWRFTETSGTTFADDVGGGVTVTISGAVTPGSAPTGPYPGQGVGADFAGGRVTATGASAWRPQTVEALVQLDTVPSTSSSARTVIYRTDSTGPLPLWMTWNIDTANQGKLGFGWYTGSAFVVISAPAAAVTPGLRHIVGVYDGATTLTIYVDGASVASGTVASRGTMTGAADTVNIGARNDGTSPLDGRLYDLALYNGGLSPTRVSAHYTASQQLAGLLVAGGGGMTGFGGNPRVQGSYTGPSGGGSMRFTSSVVSVGSPAIIHFTAHPGDFA